VDHAILGLGVLDESHRLFQAAKYINTSDGVRPWEKLNIPKEGKKDLIDLFVDINRVLEITRSKQINYFPVADISNRLIFIPPSGFSKLGNKLLIALKNLEKSVKRMNRRLYTVSIEQLQDDVVNLHIVAGGIRKAGIAKMLAGEESPFKRISSFCCDSSLANAMVQK